MGTSGLSLPPGEVWVEHLNCEDERVFWRGAGDSEMRFHTDALPANCATVEMPIVHKPSTCVKCERMLRLVQEFTRRLQQLDRQGGTMSRSEALRYHRKANAHRHV
jgi:hypothetical protein